MQAFHDKTNITIKNAFEQTQFIDWRTQPSNYKEYPSFFRRFDIKDYEELSFIENFGKITNIKKYGQEEVSLRANPSAGGLYPCEVYIQIRGIKGILSGIYHYEPLNNSLCLIHELNSDGLEYYLNQDSKKFVFLISNAYFRSSWKYEKRAIRYLLLDTGHQLGSIYASLKLQEIKHTFLFDFNKTALNEEFGFDSMEFFQSIVLVDNEKDIKPKKLRKKLLSVPATNYYNKEPFIEEFSIIKQDKNFDLLDFTFFDELTKEELQKAIDNRRSIRAFKKEKLLENEFKFITKDIFEIALKYKIEIFFINNRIKSMEKGSYKNVKLLKKGDFKEDATKLAFNQKLAGDSSFTLFFTTPKESNYIQSYILSGFFAHIIALRCSFLDIHSSGIGAFFDDKAQEFFETTNNILYLQAIGR